MHYVKYFRIQVFSDLCFPILIPILAYFMQCWFIGLNAHSLETKHSTVTSHLKSYKMQDYQC